MPTSFKVKRLERFPDISQALEVLEGNTRRDRQWWIEDHFRFAYDARVDGRVLTPTDVVGLADDFSGETMLTLLADQGVQASQRVTMWWPTEGTIATLPLGLIAAHLDVVQYPLDDIFLCHPPAPWGLFVSHEGQFSLGHQDPAFVRQVNAEDCRRTSTLTPPDDSQPDAARQNALRTALAENRQAGNPPCAGISISTRGELRWLLNHWKTAIPGVEAKPPSPWSHASQRRPDLRGAILLGANLDGTMLAGANLSGADLSGADLTGVHLQWANLTGANLTGASLYHAHCWGANFTGAILRDACLNRADMRHTVLTGADFSAAQMVGTQVGADAVSHIAETAPDTSRLWTEL